MTVLIQVSLCEAARVPAGTKLYVDVSGALAVQEGSDPDEKPFRSCVLTTEVGTWHIAVTAVELMALIVDAKIRVSEARGLGESLAVLSIGEPHKDRDEIDKVIEAVSSSDN